MDDMVKEVSTQSFGSRIIDSIKGVLVGAVLFLASFAVLWWNEGNIVDEKAAFEEMGKSLISVKSSKPEPKNDGKLIHTSGPLGSTEQLGDGTYLKPGPWLKLESKVAMYQWVEEKESKSETNVGGSKTTETTYRYKLKWAEGRVDSSAFKKQAGHENPSLAVSPTTKQVEQAKFGGYDGIPVLEKLSANTELPLTKELLLNPNLHKIQDQAIYLPVSEKSQGPKLGDVKVTFKVLKADNYSVIASQVRSGSDNLYSLQDYTATNGKTKFLVDKGSVSAKAMLKSAEDSAKLMTMIIRFIGFLMMAFGISMVLNPFATLLDVLPILGSLGRGAIGLFSGFIAAVLSTLTILIAMIAHNPLLLGAAVLSVLGASGYYVASKNKKRSAEKAQSSSTASAPIGSSGGPAKESPANFKNVA